MTAGHPNWCHPAACTAASDGRHSTIPRHIETFDGGVEILATCWAAVRSRDGMWDTHFELVFTDGAQVTVLNLTPLQGRALERWLHAMAGEVRWDRQVTKHPELAEITPFPPFPTLPGGSP